MSLSTRTVIARGGNITLTDVRFYVQPRGVARIRDKKQRSVVAYAIGTIESVDSSPAPATAGLLKVSFNPYRAAAFTTADGTEVWQHGYVIFASAVKDGRPAGYTWILRTPARAQAAHARPACGTQPRRRNPARHPTHRAGRAARTQPAQIGAPPMILNPGMITTAGRSASSSARWPSWATTASRRKAGPAAGPATWSTQRWSRWPARWPASTRTTRQTSTATSPPAGSTARQPRTRRRAPTTCRTSPATRPRTGHRVRLRQGPEATRQPGVDAAHLAPDASPRARPAAGQLRGAGRMVRCRLRPGAARPADPGRPARPARAGHARA